MNNRSRIACATAALGMALVLVPAAAQAATPPSSPASSNLSATSTAAGSSAAAPASAVVGWSQVDGGDYQIVTLELSRSATVEIRDDAGDLIDTRVGDEREPVRFLADPNGADVRAYSIVTTSHGEQAEPYLVYVDLSGAPVSRPIDQTTAEEQQAIRAGERAWDLRYAGLPYADMTLEFNGETMTVEADQDGIATFPVHFVDGVNTLAIQQQFGLKQSAVFSYQYDI